MSLAKTIFFTFLMSLLSLGLMAQQTPEGMVVDFFRTYESKDLSSAIDDFFSTNPWMAEMEEGVENLKTKAENFFSPEVSGAYYGYEILEFETIGAHYQKITCLVRYDRQPYFFRFVLYRPNDRWKAQHFSFSDKLEEE